MVTTKTTSILISYTSKYYCTPWQSLIPLLIISLLFTLETFITLYLSLSIFMRSTVWEHVEVKTINPSSSSPSSLNSKQMTTERHVHLFSPCKPLKSHTLWSKYNHSQCAESYVCFIRSYTNDTVISAEGKLIIYFFLSMPMFQRHGQLTFLRCLSSVPTDVFNWIFYCSIHHAPF